MYDHFLEACQNRFGEIIRYQNVNELSRKKYFCYFVQNSKTIYMTIVFFSWKWHIFCKNIKMMKQFPLETVHKIKGQCKVILWKILEGISSEKCHLFCYFKKHFQIWRQLGVVGHYILSSHLKPNSPVTSVIQSYLGLFF